MIIVTGGLGFIGFNIIKKFNSNNISNLIIVDDLKNKNNLINKDKIKFKKIIDYRVSLKYIYNNRKKIKYIFHNGANSDTSCWDAIDMFEKNYEYSKNLFSLALKNEINFIYASSASIYGNSKKNQIEEPLNLYAASKLMFDNYVRNIIKQKKISFKIIGLRYFNVYGPFENHKKKMSSPIMTFFNQANKISAIKIFGSINKINYKQYKRDFIYIDDVVSIIFKLYKSKRKYNEIFDLGSGISNSFYSIAIIMKNWFKIYKKKNIKIKITRFPKLYENRYQFYTRSNNKLLKKYFKNYKFISLKSGINKYLNYLDKNLY